MNRKLVVFVPREALDPVRDALFAAGAGRIGDYERCSWYTEGTGTFLGGEGTTRRVGEAGREERVAGAAARDGLPGGARRTRSSRRCARRIRTRSRRSTSTSSLAVKARLFTDGGARGNPGPAAFGYVLEAEDGTVLAAHGEAIGVATNNVAEYRALVAGLEKAAELGVAELEVVSDSELLVKQMRASTGSRTRRSPSSRSRPRAWRAQLGKVAYTAVRREHNELADRLVNEALDAASG